MTTWTTEREWCRRINKGTMDGAAVAVVRTKYVPVAVLAEADVSSPHRAFDLAWRLARRNFGRDFILFAVTRQGPDQFTRVLITTVEGDALHVLGECRKVGVACAVEVFDPSSGAWANATADAYAGRDLAAHVN